MNARIELLEEPRDALVAQAEQPRPQYAMSANPTPSDLLRIATEQGADLDRMERLMAMQERWKENERKDKAEAARNAFNKAFAAFKSEAIHIVKNIKITDGPLKNKSYADQFAVVDAVTPALSKHGLSTSWKLTRDEKDWLEVTCTLRHEDGYSETAAMGGPPDTGGAKNVIQARGSARTYLERYTLLSILGVAAQGSDDDGRGGAKASADARAFEIRDDWIGRANSALNDAVLKRTWQMGLEEIKPLNRMDVYEAFKAAVAAKGAQLTGGAS